jgi:phage FluMu gp28-like protein
MKKNLPPRIRFANKILDPVSWIKEYCGMTPIYYQEEFLRDNLVRNRVVRKSRQVGMTRILAMEAVWRAFNFRDKLEIIISPSLRQSKIVMYYIRQTIQANPELAKRVKRISQTEVMTDLNSRIICLPNAPALIRGYSPNWIDLDEAAHFPNDEEIMAVIRPMLIATKGTLTVVSTPFGKTNMFFELYNQAVNLEKEYPDYKKYDLFPSTISPFITKERLDRERELLTEDDFKQEYYGEFIEHVGSYFPMIIIEPCIDKTPSMILNAGEKGRTYYMGIDFAKERDQTVVMIGEKIPVVKNKGQPNQSTVKILCVRHIEEWSDTNYAEQIARIVELKQKFPLTKGQADQTGVGEYVMEDIKKVAPQIEGTKFTQSEKVSLASSLKLCLEKELIRIPDDRKLIMQLNNVRYEQSKAGNVLFRSPDKRKNHDDYVWALALLVKASRHQDLAVNDLFGE